MTSPVATFAPTLYLDISLPAGGSLALPPLAAEMAVYPVQGRAWVDGQPMAAQAMAVLQPGAAGARRARPGPPGSW